MEALSNLEIQNKMKKGQSIIRRNRKIFCKIYFRPVFFKDTSVSWDKEWNIEIPKMGISKSSNNLDELISIVNEYMN